MRRKEALIFEVFMESTNGHAARQGVRTVDTEQEARDFCEENNWVMFDEHGYMWDLDYRKVA